METKAMDTTFSAVPGVKLCQCSVCQVPLQPSYSTAYSDGFCEFCDARCFPVVTSATGRRDRILMSLDARAKLHAKLTQPNAVTVFGEALKQVVMQHGPPLLKQAAEDLVKRSLRRWMQPR
jgi:recombinational DNA repair protein (RecF pathway)